MAKRKKPGRPKGSKNKSKIDTSSNSVISPMRRGKTNGKTGTGKRRGRPPGIKSKRRGRLPTKNSLLAAGGHVNGIHFIGRSLIVDTDQMSIDEVVFLGGKAPKVR